MRPGRGCRDGTFDGADDFRHVERFRQEGERTEANGFLRSAEFRMPGHDDDGYIWKDFFGGGRELNAIDAGHGEVSDDEVEASS